MLGLILTDKEEMIGRDYMIIVYILLGIFLFISLEMGFIYLILLRRFKSINVTLTEDAIVYTNLKKQIIIPYEDIEKLEFPSIKYTGGWVKIIYKGGNIRLTVVLEHIGEFISELKERLNKRQMEHVYNEKKMFSFFKTAVFSDESWERVYHNARVQVTVHFLCIIFTTIILLFSGYSENNHIYIMGSVFAPLLGYLISEVIIGNRVKKRIISEELKLLPRNPEFEYKIFNILIIGFSIAYLLLILIIA
ncbi:MAG: hypothetical protein ACYDEX_25990 [Mobilitalea sp.]